LTSGERDRIVNASSHLLWITFSRQSTYDNDYPRVIMYISIWLTQLQFSLRKNILNHRDINLILFFNKGTIFFIINIVLKYLKNTEINICNILVMTGDFNIGDSDWDSSYPYHLVFSDTLLEITDYFDLKLSFFINQVPTRYADNPYDANLVINLMFFQPDFRKNWQLFDFTRI